MEPIVDYNRFCDHWKPTRDVKGKPIKTKACWSCYFNLWLICWLQEYEKSNKLVVFALEGNEKAKMMLYKQIAKLIKT